MTDGIVQRIVALPESPSPWPTVDPYLFCVHHDDSYPRGDGSLAPAAALDGRQIGADFSRTDGWSMYHGSTVPGFPQHPHRGFETVTIVRQGLIDHADSLGAVARFGQGDVQWVTAGAGIVHSEMFPLINEDRPNPVELFQIWLNLPADRKLAEPHFTMLWAEDLPRLEGEGTVLVVVAGELEGHRPPPPPPESWAADPRSEVAIWLGALEAGATLRLPAAAGSETIRSVYVFEGSGVTVDRSPVAASHVAVLRADRAVELAAPDGPAEVLVLQGRPIGEPVAQYGPFVMNDRAGIEQAFEDYRRTGFGGWPWDRDDPVHGARPRRFARHPDGRFEEPVG